MGDPQMVSRAERAAAALERAWERWRIMHGLAAEPTPPVSSYVGYSIEEPWGRPRVVFGVDAAEAELLAALLDRTAGVGAVHLPHQQDLIHDGQVMMGDSQVMMRDEPVADQEDPSLFLASQEFRYDACGPADDRGLLYDAYGLPDEDALREEQGALREEHALSPDGATPVEEGAGPDRPQPAPAAPRPAGGAAEPAGRDGEDGNGSQVFRGKPGANHPDEQAQPSGATGNDHTGTAGQPARGPDAAPPVASPEQETADRAAGARPKPGDPHAEPSAAASAVSADKDSPPAVRDPGPGHDPEAAGDGAAEPAGAEAESAGPSHTNPAGAGSGREAGVAGAGERPGRAVANVADGLLHATDGCDPGFARPSQAAPGGGRAPAGPEASVSRAAPETGDVGIAAELAGWAAGELPGQASARLAEWVAMGRAPKQGPQGAGKPGVSAATRRR
jgi:hypothetical protein